jgi:hypothetical protein
MEFQLIDQELSEARLYRTTSQFGAFDGRDIANLIYLITMSTYMTSNDYPTEKIGKQYARRTIQNGPYAIFKTHANDLYLLCYTALHPNNDHVNMRNKIVSKRFLDRLNFNGRAHIQFLRNIVSGYADDAKASTYFFRLEQQLKIQDPKYKQWRRVVSNWSNATTKQKANTRNNIYKEFRRVGRGAGVKAEMAGLLSSSMNDRTIKRLRRDMDLETRPSTARRVAGTVAGAAAGRYVAGKIKDTPRSKNIGTGLGAIAGYWASGRRKS